MTDDMVVFLRARLDEDAERAEAARVHMVEEGVPGWFRERDVERAGFELVDAAMLAVHADPARVLREVEAHRRVVDIYAGSASVRAPDLSEVVCGLAAVYAGHPDYKQEWRT